jgi:hypothetical protein
LIEGAKKKIKNKLRRRTDRVDRKVGGTKPENRGARGNILLPGLAPNLLRICQEEGQQALSVGYSVSYVTSRLLRHF